MEQNRAQKQTHTYIWSINLWQRSQEYTMGERTVSSINGAENETGSLSYTIDKLISK